MRRAALSLILVWGLLFYAAPLAVAVVFSFLTPRTFGGVELPITLQNYAFTGATLRMFVRTVGVALAAAVICTAVAFVVSGDARLRPSGRKNRLILGLAVFSMITNSLMRVYAWVLILPRIDAWLATLVGMIYLYLPLAMLLVHESVQSVDPGLIRAARDLGATEGVLWRRILWPLVRLPALGAAAIVFVFVCSDFLVPQILGRGLVVMTGNRMSDLFLQQANWPATMAIGTVLLVTLFAALFGLYFRKRPA